MVDALEEGVCFTFDGVPITLTEPQVSLGSHETRVRFLVVASDVPMVYPHRASNTPW